MHTFMDTQNIQKIVRVSLNIKDKQGTKVLERSLGLDITSVFYIVSGDVVKILNWDVVSGVF